MSEVLVTVTVSDMPLSVSDDYSRTRLAYLQGLASGCSVELVEPKKNSKGLWSLAYIRPLTKDNKRGEQ